MGGGGVRVRLASSGSEMESRIDRPVPRLSGRVDVDTVADLVIGAVQRGRRELGASSVSAIGIGMTGIPGLVDSPERLARTLQRALHAERVVVAGDSVTTHAGALNGDPGVVIAAGTGAIALGRGQDGVWKRSDGWGYLVGDEGSGAWIGRRGIAAGLRAWDGRRGGSELLLAALLTEFGDPATLVDRIYGDALAAHVLAGFARPVAAAANAGDAVAREIWADAGRRLGRTAVAAVTGEPLFSWGGRLFDVGDLLLLPFHQEVRRCVPDARFVPPQGGSARGAQLLAGKALEDALPSQPPFLFVYG
ncbi:BadF/BadG/BcrA/BcrD ATPase family protein [Amnibacterium sp. CER49]|nr:BadF/BadG/BcrA/BcrD ATPase family protein [Amnibacterium sp. CER49]MDH2442583.1 BadF/BadG/BcrA/BcrD ATPase family protein [Amnibacterium sp. CER49]